MRYVEHITLTTGHARRSMSGEVTGAAIAACQVSLAFCLAKPGVHAALAADLPPPDMARYSLTATSAGRCLLATVWREAAPICTIGIAGHARCAGRLWTVLHTTATTPLSTTEDDRPQAPWCAARLEPGLATHIAAAEWLGDYERCLAWAWLSRVER